MLFCIFLLPLPMYKLFWLVRSTKTTGTFYFTGHGNLGSVLGVSTYPVIWFLSERDTVYFNGNVNVPLKPDEKVSVRYQSADPSDAKMNTFSCIWGDTMAYELGPLLIFIIIFCHPDLVPRKSRILIGSKPLLKFLEN